MTLQRKKICLNAIAPGWVTVERYYKMILGFNDEDARKVAAEKVPGTRSGEKVEIVKLGVLLCLEDAGNFIGRAIIADGGTTSLTSFISDFRIESSAHFGQGCVPGV